MNNHYHDSGGTIIGLMFAVLILSLIVFVSSQTKPPQAQQDTASLIAIERENTKQAEAAQAAAVAAAVPAVVEQIEDMLTISYFFVIIVGAGVIIVLLLAYQGGFIRPAPKIVKTDEYGRPYGPWRD